jgi:hypothetical protein
MKTSTILKSGAGINRDFNMKALHDEMQEARKGGDSVTLRSYLAANKDPNYTPEQFYRDLGVDLSSMHVDKMLSTTNDVNRWLFPEVVRDAVLVGLDYTPFYGSLIAAEEQIDNTGITMPSMDFRNVDRNEVRLRDTNEGATITEGQIVTWQSKQVNVRKKARGLKQTYESIMFTPIDLAAIYFEELGVQLGADLDAELIQILFNGDQADGSQAAPVIGAASQGTLSYQDIARTWIRFARLGRQSTVMIASENDANTLLNMAEFKKTQIPNGVTPSGVTLNISRPLPTTQDIFTHDAIPDGKIIFLDRRRAAVQLTAMPLLVESERIVSRQITGEFVSIITGFANLFKDGRLVLDYTTSLTTNPGPVPPVR